MVTSELISYIRKQIENNIPKDLTISKLADAGWRQEDIDEGFSNIESEEPKPIRTPADEPPKIQTPVDMPAEREAQTENPKTSEKSENREIEIQNEELPSEKVELIPTLIKKTTVNPPSNLPVGIFKQEPVENKKEEVAVEQAIKPAESRPVEKPIVKPAEKPVAAPMAKSSPTARNSIVDILPKTAISASPNNLSANKKTTEKIIAKKGHNIRRLVFILVIIFVCLGALIFAVGIKDLNIPFIKKDPKVLLLDNSKVLSSLQSYKTETSVEVSSPSFSNISMGLASGQAVNQPDKDTISVNTEGMINQGDEGLLSDNSITIRSSLLQEDITTDIKDNGSNLFVSVPDLSEILAENAPEPSIVKIYERQFDLIPPLFSFQVGQILGKINLYKILSSGAPSYIDTGTLSTYDDLIDSASITEKGGDIIKGVDTYHYSINADNQLVKRLLSKISDNFVLNLSDDDKNNLDQILGSTTVVSFDVWIGKEDNNIYQYNVVLDIPLSKILGFTDASIGDNTITVSWKTTYYDFNVQNNIIMPTSSVEATDFINSVKELKIKNNVLSFKQFASDLLGVEKTYGNNSNTKGSCMEPVSGSLFSPLGHTKKSSMAISAISLFLNTTLNITKNIGYCYSTPKAWSFTIPISDNYDATSTSIPIPEYKSLFCIDSTGFSGDLTAPPAGVLCSPAGASVTN